MDVRNIVKLINAVPITEQTAITQLKHMEDDEPYQVWTIDTGTARYILKEAKYGVAHITILRLRDGEGNT